MGLAPYIYIYIHTYTEKESYVRSLSPPFIVNFHGSKQAIWRGPPRISQNEQLSSKHCNRPDLLQSPGSLKPQKCIWKSEKLSFSNPLGTFFAFESPKNSLFRLRWGLFFSQKFRKGVGDWHTPKNTVSRNVSDLLLRGHRKKGAEKRPQSLAQEGFLRANPLGLPTPFRNFCFLGPSCREAPVPRFGLFSTLWARRAQMTHVDGPLSVNSPALILSTNSSVSLARIVLKWQKRSGKIGSQMATVVSKLAKNRSKLAKKGGSHLTVEVLRIYTHKAPSTSYRVSFWRFYTCFTASFAQSLWWGQFGSC